MRTTSLTLLLAGLLSPALADACAHPPVAKPFDAAAPTATNIVAVQVESLALERDESSRILGGHAFLGKIRVLKHFRGTAEFLELKYRNDSCYGLHIDVGGIYLTATDKQETTLELHAYDAPILPINGFFTFDPRVVLRVSNTVKQLEAALRGERSFDLTTPADRAALSTEGPAPFVPPP